MNRQLRFQRWSALVAVTLCAAAVAFGAGLILRQSHGSIPSLPSPPHARQDLSVARHVGPSLGELQANFAVLRRPATAREHALLPTFTAATDGRPEVPEYVRQSGVVDGIHVYFVVYPVFRHGASGPVVAYQMNVLAGSAGYSYIPGNYLMFPEVVGRSDQSGLWQPQAYVSVVPDGVRSVRWRFTCAQAPAGSGCQLPGERGVSMPVRGNLAVLPISVAAAAVPTVNRVTWYRSGGSTSVFTNENTAVPFPGAPAWRAG